MTKQETIRLMQVINGYYPNFDVTEERAEAWKNSMVEVEYKIAYRNLMDYVSTEEKNVAPSIARLKRNAKKSDFYHFMVFDQHRDVIIWRPSETADAVEIPVFYYKGTFIDDEGREYAFPNMNVEYWDDFYKERKMQRVIVPVKDAKGNPQYNHENKAVTTYQYVPEGMSETMIDAVQNINFDIGVEE